MGVACLKLVRWGVGTVLRRDGCSSHGPVYFVVMTARSLVGCHSYKRMLMVKPIVAVQAFSC